jgi:hypothetical protein
MIKDTKRPNGTIKRIQYVKAPRGGVSSMGVRYKKGDAIVHLSSSRCTGETFVLLPKDILRVLGLGPGRHGPDGLARAMARPGRWASPKKWAEQLKAIWNQNFTQIHGHPPGGCAQANHPPEFWAQAKEAWKKLGARGF